MSTRVLEETAEALPLKGSPGQTKPTGLSIIQRVDDWLRVHLGVLALTMIAAGFIFRVFLATRTYLNPDEALHYLLFNQVSVWEAYKASLTNAHPPLIYLILYYWHMLGKSELMLRMPSALAGAGFCWFGFRWLKEILGKAAGLIGLVFFSFTPALVALSAEVRAYSVMLFCLAGALYFLASALDQKSAGQMWCFSVFLWLAIFTHYSVLFFTIAVGVYALARIQDSRLPRNVVLAWAIGQGIAIAEYGFLYVTHVSKLRKIIPVWGFEYSGSYYQWGDGDILSFTWRKTLSIFTFLFAERYLALAAFLIFLAAVSLILGRDISGKRKDAGMNRLGILLLLPFAIVWGAALARIYPYAGTRHTVFLAPFAIAGISFILASMTRQRLWAGLLLAALSVTASNLFMDGVALDAFSDGRSPALMKSATDYMRKTIPQADVVFTDYQSAMTFVYYFCGPDHVVPMTFSGKFFESNCRGNPIISTHEWKLIPIAFQSRFRAMASSQNLKSQDRVWVFQTGWGQNLDTSLPEHDPSYRCLNAKDFGEHTTLIPFLVSRDLNPELSQPSCSNFGN